MSSRGASTGQSWSEECSRACEHWEAATFVLVRALTYATLFVGFLLVFLPARILAASGVVRPAAFGPLQIAGVVIGAAGALLAVGCIFTFALIGKGTPAPFDPPRRLVMRGPYGYVRNPMYVGAGMALAGAALTYGSRPLLLYDLAFLAAVHLFVVAYEEPVLLKLFGAEYDGYRRRVPRWFPRFWPAASTPR